MTDKEKLEAIKAELHRLKEVRGVYKDIFNDIFAFINSLPEEPEFTPIEKAVVNGWTIRIDNKRVPITLKGGLKHKFRNEFNTMWQTVGGMQFANVCKAIMEHLCLHFAAWGAYNLKNIGNMSEEEKTK